MTRIICAPDPDIYLRAARLATVQIARERQGSYCLINQDYLWRALDDDYRRENPISAQGWIDRLISECRHDLLTPPGVTWGGYHVPERLDDFIKKVGE